MSAEAGRVHGLDFIRGVCAAAVCVYHVLLWSGGPELHALGTYGVYLFFVVSGASLYTGYAHGLHDKVVLIRFFARRFFRLAPLYIAVVCCWLLVNAMARGDTPDIAAILLNFSLLFGFFGAGELSFVTGGWSIGIEVVFYALFPLLLPLVRSRLWMLVMMAAFVGQHAYIQMVLDTAPDLWSVWAPYTQPVSFAFYFVAGMCVARAMRHRRLPYNDLYWFALVVLLALFVLLPSATYKSILLGPTGWVLSGATVLVAAVSAGLRFRKKSIALAELLGSMSYGLYLVHPMVYGALSWVWPVLSLHPWALVACTVTVSGALALLTEHLYEKPVRTWLASKLPPQARSAGGTRKDPSADYRWVPVSHDSQADEPMKTGLTRNGVLMRQSGRQSDAVTPESTGQ